MSRRKRTARRLRLAALAGALRTSLASALLAGLPVIGALGLWVMLDRPIRAVIVEGPFERVSAIQVEASLGDLGGTGFLSADLEDLQGQVEALAWVDTARIARRWPGSLRVAVTEQRSAARWREQGLLNTRGELFVANARHVPAELPHLEGPPGSEAEVATRYLEARERLAAVGFGVTKVRLDARGSWRLTLANGIEIRLGRKAFTDRLDRFAATATRIIQIHEHNVAYVDMRYDSGFAVGWREGSEHTASKKQEVSTDV